DDGLIRRLLLTAGAVLGIRAVELGVFLDDRVGLPFAAVLLGIEQRTRSRIGDLRIIARAFALGALIGGFARSIGRFLRRIVRPGIVGSAAGAGDISPSGGVLLFLSVGTRIVAGEVLDALALFVGEPAVRLLTAVAALLLLLLDLLL